MFAVIETGGKQYKVQEGDVLFVEKLEAETGEKVTFDRVLAVSADSGFKTGMPTVEGRKRNGFRCQAGQGQENLRFEI